MAMCARANRRWTVLIGLLLLLLASQVATAGTATVVLQNGSDGYAGASDDGRAGAVKLTDDRKSTDPRYPNPDYRHLLRFADLGSFVLGKGVKVVSAEVSLRYYDEWWSLNVYHLSLSRSQDGTVDSIASPPEDTVLLYGDRFDERQKTPRPSWVTWKLRPETVEQWLAHPEQNRGLVLRVAERDSSRGDAGNSGVTFRGCEYGMARERPRLTVTYTYTGNLPPQAPQWAVRYANASVGREHVLRWSPARDVDGDAVRYEIEVARGTGKWQRVAANVTGTGIAWKTTGLPAGEGYRLRLRARDAHGAYSAWTASEGRFAIVREEVLYQVGVAGAMEKIRRDVPYAGALGGTLRMALARNESEGGQIVVANVNRDLHGLRGEGSELRSGANVLAASAITVRQVGYVNTVNCDAYSSPYVGLWPDPLLELSSVDVPAGKVQPLWVTVHAPAGTSPGDYRGTITLTTKEAPPVRVPLEVRVWDITLPQQRAFRGMVVEGPRTEAAYARLLANHLSPAYALVGWSWDKPQSPVVETNGAWDFAEVDRLLADLLPQGLNVFTVARLPRPGLHGFPDHYSPEFREHFHAFLKAYADHLRERGWLSLARAYNIDEAPAAYWETCRENYREVKAAAPDLAVMQCLNDPAGVAALVGAVDVWDLYIRQFNQAGGPARVRAGEDAITALCCYPASHPNLFIDYPGIDARIVGWVNWKIGATGFEYWSASSWGDNLTRLGPHGFLDSVESAWRANTFGNYNGDGYLLYPGPEGTVLSSMRLENLRDGCEDYELLALLKARVATAKAAGRDVAAAEKLLSLDGVCEEDLSYTPDPQALLAARERVAEAVVALGQ
jgi:hypothetical protein